MMMNSTLNEQILQAYIQKVFDKYDTDRSGGLDQDQLTLFFNDLFKTLKIPGKITVENAREAIKSMDQNSDGTIDRKQLFDAFKLLMTRQNMQQSNQSMQSQQGLNNYGYGMPPPYNQNSYQFPSPYGYPGYGYTPYSPYAPYSPYSPYQQQPPPPPPPQQNGSYNGQNQLWMNNGSNGNAPNNYLGNGSVSGSGSGWNHGGSWAKRRF